MWDRRNANGILIGWEVVDFSGSRQEQVIGYFEQCNESSGSIKCGEFRD